MIEPEYIRETCVVCSGSGAHPTKRKTTCPRCRGERQQKRCPYCMKLFDFGPLAEDEQSCDCSRIY